MNALLKLFVLLMLVGSPIMSLAQPTVDLTTTKVDADEAGQDIGSILVTRTNEGNTAEALTVYMLSSGSAGYPTDFSTSGMAWHGGNQWSIVIPGNQFSASGTITPRFEEILEGEETVTFTLQEEDTFYFLGLPDEATITIADFIQIIFKDSFEDR